ncbi:hypothetical protein Hanom_Chr05g00466861 [Helianthus anomalus]
MNMNMMDGYTAIHIMLQLIIQRLFTQVMKTTNLTTILKPHKFQVKSLLNVLYIRNHNINRRKRRAYKLKTQHKYLRSSLCSFESRKKQ